MTVGSKRGRPDIHSHNQTTHIIDAFICINIKQIEFYNSKNRTVSKLIALLGMFEKMIFL